MPMFMSANLVFAESSWNNSTATATTSKSTNVLYYESDVFDYYLTKNQDGSSAMHVKEKITAVFPESNANHGITVGIGYLNQNGANFTAKSLESLDFKATRDGALESIAKTETVNGSYVFYLGNFNEYLHGKHVYELEYDFQNVVTGYNGSGALAYNSDIASEELYWDTNGLDSIISIDQLTARVHVPAEIAPDLTGKTACYVGKYGTNNTQRCSTSLDDEVTYNSAAANSSALKSAEVVISFETNNLLAGENLTFVVEFSKDAFVIPAPAMNYALVITTVVVGAVCLLIIVLTFRSWLKNGKPKKDYYKKLFLAPEYQAPKELCVAEAAQLLIKPGKNSYVATLLELAVSGKLSIIKGEPSKILKKETWSLKINNLNGITKAQEDFLKIMNNGTAVAAGDVIKVEKHTPTLALERLSKDYDADSFAAVKELDFMEAKSTQKAKSSVAVAIIVGVFGIFAVYSLNWIKGIFGQIFSSGGVLVGADFLPIVIIISIVATMVICGVISNMNSRYKRYTNKGLDMANRLEGLRLYISMAEKERLEFLQSVKGADTSSKGIVKLYEKLLPYASLFGLEKSWMQEFERYCQETNYTTRWYSGSDFITYTAFYSFSNSINSNIASSTHYVASSTGSSSSGFSGISGGFSGGGGGGGGRGGW